LYTILQFYLLKKMLILL